ncbi:YggT family protein [Candidatus Berkelbacteria bacterium]|nr:YggT family protein [Candidatus Berkelbacteria bacterium]
MPVEVRKEVTTTSEGPVSDQVSQTATTSQVSTNTEVQDAHSDRGNAWIWYLVGIIDLLLVLDIVFKLFGAKSVGFASFLYSITNFFAAPFRGIFPNPKIEGAYFDTAAFVAIIVYILVGWIVARLIDLATRPASSKKI